MAKHVHAELIKAWADGAQIEVWSEALKEWRPTWNPGWNQSKVYRVKPQSVTVYVPVCRRNMDGEVFLGTPSSGKSSIREFTYHSLVGSVRLEVSGDGKRLISATMED